MSKRPAEPLNDEAKALLVVRSAIFYAAREVVAISQRDSELRRALEDACVAVDDELRNVGVLNADAAQNALEPSNLN